jgi:hypothetical protein
VGGAEIVPDAEQFAGGSASLGGVGIGGDLESSAEVSGEAMLLGRWSSFQGLGCGYFCSKCARNSESVSVCNREASSAITLSCPGRKAARWQ